MHFKNVHTDLDVDLVCRLADEIWHEHYASIISDSQIDYMLRTFQSAQAIREQCQSGFEYFVIFDDDQPVGYLSVLANQYEHNLFLSKYYLLKNARGRGLGRKMMDYLESLALAQQLSAIYLTVNRQNTGAIIVYQKLGFHIVGPCITEIGEGYRMDDYKMMKNCSQIPKPFR